MNLHSDILLIGVRICGNDHGGQREEMLTRKGEMENGKTPFEITMVLKK